ncbi:hypothetical protein ACBI99_44700 [Nonomuraea sp. ATR24]|uniref:hypothetical protein n=1 Tax=Nonomuraea sp. ATR24 TaxID=1676744 RepID=UPI0035C16F00
MALPEHLKRHTVTVQPYLGAGPTGSVYGAPFSRRGYAEDKRQLVRDAAGDEVVSEATFYCDQGPEEIPPKSKITLPSGRTALVITANRRDSAIRSGRDHLEVTLT